MDYLTFRSNALANLSLMKEKPKFASSDEKESWVRAEYDRHYSKSNDSKGGHNER